MIRLPSGGGGVVVASVLLGCAFLPAPVSALDQATTQTARPSCHGRIATIVGTPGEDRLRGSAKSDVIVGLGGDDVIAGRAGDDLVCGGAGDDEIDGGFGDDRLWGEGGADVFRGGPGRNGVHGGAPVTASRRDGCDRVDYAASGTPVHVDLTTGRASRGGARDLLAGLECVTGTEHADTMVAAPRIRAYLHGLGGDDHLKAARHGATLIGDAGDDVLLGGPGGDDLIGRTGDDTMRGGHGDDGLIGGRGDDVGTDNGGDDLVIDDYGTRNVYTLDGPDSREGDTVQLGSGELSTGPGGDEIYGSAGSIDAGPGRDVIQVNGSGWIDPRAPLEVHAGSGSDIIGISPRLARRAGTFDGGSGDDWMFMTAQDGIVVELTMGAPGTWVRPFHGQFASIESLSATGHATYLITGSDQPEDIQLEGVATDSHVWALGGDDTVTAPHIDGGEGLDTCHETIDSVNCP